MVRARACSHWLAFQIHALGLNGLHKLHKSVRADYADIFLRIDGIHFAQAAAKSLFRQNIAFGRISPQADNGRNIAHIPAFLEHQDGNNGFIGAVRRVNFIGQITQELKLFLCLAGTGFGNFAIVFGMDNKDAVFTVITY